MKKLLLVLSFTSVLTACGDIESDVTSIAEDYCMAIKQKDWKDAKEHATSDVLRNRENMFEQNMGKYSQLFASQNCDVTNIESQSETYHSVYFGGSKLDSVEIEWDKRKEQFFVVSDAFKNDLKLY